MNTLTAAFFTIGFTLIVVTVAVAYSLIVSPPTTFISPIVHGSVSASPTIMLSDTQADTLINEARSATKSNTFHAPSSTEKKFTDLEAEIDEELKSFKK